MGKEKISEKTEMAGPDGETQLKIAEQLKKQGFSPRAIRNVLGYYCCA